MPNGTKIKIVNSSGAGTNNDQAILDELKKMSDFASKTYKRDSSGLMGVFGGGGKGLYSFVAAVVAAVAVVSGGKAKDSGRPSVADDYTDRLESEGWWGLGKKPNYEKIYDPDSGRFLYAETDEKTGQILNILTEQEAKQKGILDEAGKIKGKYERTHSVFDEITEGMDKHKDAVILSADMAEELGLLEDEEARIQKAINKAKRDKLRNLGGEYSFPDAGSPVLPGGVINPSGQVILESEIQSPGIDNFMLSIQNNSNGFAQALQYYQNQGGYN